MLRIESVGCCSAALFTRISSLLNSRRVLRIARLQKVSRPISPGIKATLLPVSLTSRAVSLASRCSLRYTIATSAPSDANAKATARPIPLSPPVISATRPASLPLLRIAMTNRFAHWPHVPLAARLLLLMLSRPRFSRWICLSGHQQVLVR